MYRWRESERWRVMARIVISFPLTYTPIMELTLESSLGCDFEKERRRWFHWFFLGVRKPVLLYKTAAPVRMSNSLLFSFDLHTTRSLLEIIRTRCLHFVPTFR